MWQILAKKKKWNQYRSAWNPCCYCAPFFFQLTLLNVPAHSRSSTTSHQHRQVFPPAHPHSHAPTPTSNRETNGKSSAKQTTSSFPESIVLLGRWTSWTQLYSSNPFNSSQLHPQVVDLGFLCILLIPRMFLLSACFFFFLSVKKKKNTNKNDTQGNVAEYKNCWEPRSRSECVGSRETGVFTYFLKT